MGKELQREGMGWSPNMTTEREDGRSGLLFPSTPLEEKVFPKNGNPTQGTNNDESLGLKRLLTLTPPILETYSACSLYCPHIFVLSALFFPPPPSPHCHSLISTFPPLSPPLRPPRANPPPTTPSSRLFCQTTVADVFKKYPSIEQEVNDEVANHEWCTNIK